jgi:hypothetical protein
MLAPLPNRGGEQRFIAKCGRCDYVKADNLSEQEVSKVFAAVRTQRWRELRAKRRRVFKGISATDDMVRQVAYQQRRHDRVQEELTARGMGSLEVNLKVRRMSLNKLEKFLDATK